MLQNGAVSLSPSPVTYSNSSISYVAQNQIFTPFSAQHSSEELEELNEEFNEGVALNATISEMDQKATNFWYGLGNFIGRCIGTIKETPTTEHESDTENELIDTVHEKASLNRSLTFLERLSALYNCNTDLHNAVLENDFPYIQEADNTMLNTANSNGDTPLHLAAREGTYSCFKTLYDKGAACNLQNEDGDTPLHIAARLGNDEMVVLLLNKADPSLPNKQGQTARLLATDTLIKHYIEQTIRFQAVSKEITTDSDFVSSKREASHEEFLKSLEKALYDLGCPAEDPDTGIFNSAERALYYSGPRQPIRNDDTESTHTPEATEKPSIKP